MMNDTLQATDIKQRLQDSVFLSEQEYAAVNEAVFETPIGANNLITAFPVVNTPNEWQTWYEYHKLDKYGNATESSMPGDADAIEVNGSKVRVELPFYHADFKYSRFDVETARQLGGRLDTVKAMAAAEKVNTLLNEALWSRSSAFGTLGAYGLFTGTATAAATWDSAGADAIFNDVNGWLAAIPEAYQSDRNVLILNQTNYFEMARVNSYGLSAMKQIKEAYPGLTIMFNKEVSEGTGLLFPFRPDVVHLVLGFPLRAVEWEVKPFEAQYKVLRSARLVVVAPSAGLKLSGI